MRILGIDPGTGRMGWGVVDQKEGEETVEYVAHGCAVTEQETPMPHRLKSLHKDLGVVISTYKPDCMVVELLFFGINARTAMAVSQARGVVMLISAQKELSFFEYTSIAVKNLLSGSGKTEKKEIQAIVRRLLSKNKQTLQFSAKDKAFDDAADALAIAIHHAWKVSGKAVTMQAISEENKKQAKIKLREDAKLVREKQKITLKKKGKKRGV